MEVFALVAFVIAGFFWLVILPTIGFLFVIGVI